jgi:hypothetical protein
MDLLELTTYYGIMLIGLASVLLSVIRAAKRITALRKRVDILDQKSLRAASRYSQCSNQNQ